MEETGVGGGTTTTVKILSWNTLESGPGGAWSSGWGCPLEIRRRDELAGSLGISGSEAERMLTEARYRRIRASVLQEDLLRPPDDDDDDDDVDDVPPPDFLLFQECTAGDSWDDDGGDDRRDPSKSSGDVAARDSRDETFFEALSARYEKVPCAPDHDDDDHNDDDHDDDPETLQHVYVRRDSGWRISSSVRLRSGALVGGCLAEFAGSGGEEENDESTGEQQQQQQRRRPPLVLVNLHGKSGTMRDPDLRRAGILDLWDEIGSRLGGDDDDDDGRGSAATTAAWGSRIVLCGDWNTELSDLVPTFREACGGDDGPLRPVAGLLDDDNAMTATTTITTAHLPLFSTNHEAGFLAQYDGCLWFGSDPFGLASETLSSSSSYHLEPERVSRNLTGFMPKGIDGRLTGDFSYRGRSGDDDADENDDENEGVRWNGILLPGSDPSTGLSDHLRIYTTLRIIGDDDDGDDVDDDTRRDRPRRRPHRRHDGTGEGDGDSSDRRSQEDEEEDDADPDSGPKRLRG